MRIVNENRRMAHYFHLNMQAHPNTRQFMNAFLPYGDYDNTFDSKQFDQVLETHLITHQSSVDEILDQVFGS